MDTSLDLFKDFGVFGIVFAAITIPIVRAMLKQQAIMLKQNREALELVRKSVDTNTDAVNTFKTLTEDMKEVKQILAEMQRTRA